MFELAIYAISPWAYSKPAPETQRDVPNTVYIHQQKAAKHNNPGKPTLLSTAAIPEISRCVVVIPINDTSQHIFWTVFFSVYIHNPSQSLFKELYLLHFVQNLA